MFRPYHIIPILALLAGCSGLLNPYEEEFACPYLSEGACQSATAAYEKSLVEGPETQRETQETGGSVVGYRPQVSRQRTEAPSFAGMGASVRVIRWEPIPQAGPTDPLKAAKETYRTRTYEKLNALLGRPETPMIAPPEVIRVLFLPRVDGEEGNQITMARFRYLIVKPSRWVLKDPFEETIE